MSKHTLGPWVSSKFGYQVLTGDSWNTICELRGPAEWEDKRGSYEQEFEWQIQQANARLIAASPELLSIVKRFIALPSRAWHPERHAAEEAELMQEAREVVTKAEAV